MVHFARDVIHDCPSRPPRHCPLNTRPHRRRPQKCQPPAHARNGFLYFHVIAPVGGGRDNAGRRCVGA
eukprot:2853184-Lingulodinium_polyedra.AAC.1